MKPFTIILNCLGITTKQQLRDEIKQSAEIITRLLCQQQALIKHNLDLKHHIDKQQSTFQKKLNKTGRR